MDPADRETLMELLKTTAGRLESVLNAVPAEQWTRKPAPDAWSPSEVAEHLILTELTVGPAIRTKLLETPVVEPAADPQKFDAIMLARIPDRTPGRRRLDAPGWLRPEGRYAVTPAEACTAFAKARAETLEFIRTTEHPLRSHKMPHPGFGEIDGCQWVIFLAAHTERHLRQIEESLAP